MHKRIIKGVSFLDTRGKKEWNMTDSERMNALDFIISVLREHEKTLDSLIERLKNISSHLDVNKKSDLQSKCERGSSVRILCEEWEEFKELSREAEVFSFHLGSELKIMALHGNRIYEYKEPILTHIGYLKNGIPIRFQARLDPERIKRFLLKELNISGKKIIRGEIRFSP